MKKKGFYLPYLLSVMVMITLAGPQRAQTKEFNSDSIKVGSKAIYWKSERNYIGMLAAYSVVYKGWQSNNARGSNIGSVPEFCHFLKNPIVKNITHYFCYS